jgi:phosphatidylglycerol:prolipoprotein diacylglycerol transferase
MCPVLLKIGQIEIRAHGLLLAISFIVWILWSMVRAQRRGIDKNHIVHMSLIIFLSALLGARMMYFSVHLKKFESSLIDIINPFNGSGSIGFTGLGLLGGLIVAILSILIYSSIRKIPILKLFDAIAPPFSMGVFLSRIGCFLHGCCYGRPCDLPWGIKFPIVSAAGLAFYKIRIHPTQLYSSLYALVLTIVLVRLDKKNHFDGFLFCILGLLYGVFRFIVDFFRFYRPSETINLFGMFITVNQVISIFIILFALVIFIRLNRKRIELESEVSS